MLEKGGNRQTRASEAPDTSKIRRVPIDRAAQAPVRIAGLPLAGEASRYLALGHVVF